MKKNNNSFVKVPNRIIGKLKRNHCAVYLYLLYLCSVQGSATVKVKAQTIADALGIKHRETVSREIKAISKLGFVVTEENYTIFGKQKCNSITVVDYGPQNDYFLLPGANILLGMPGIAVELMCVLYSFSFGNSYAMPSLPTIQKVANMNKSSIVKAYSILEEYGIIIKKNYRKQDGSFGNNRYFFISKIEKLVGEERAIRFSLWLRKTAYIFLEAWQCVKDILTGNFSIIDQMDAPTEEVEEAVEPSAPTDTSTPNRPGLFAQIIEFVRRKARSIFDKFSSAVRRNHTY